MNPVEIKDIYPLPPRYEECHISKIPNEIKLICDEMKESRKGLFLHGGVGTGKTFIAYAIARYLYEEKKIKVKFENSLDILEEIKRCALNKSEFWAINELSNFKGLIVLDDLGCEKSSEWVQQTLYSLINKRYISKIPIVITSNYNLTELAERIGERTVSRIVEMCNVIELTGDDRRLM